MEFPQERNRREVGSGPCGNATGWNEFPLGDRGLLGSVYQTERQNGTHRHNRIRRIQPSSFVRFRDVERAIPPVTDEHRPADPAADPRRCSASMLNPDHIANSAQSLRIEGRKAAPNIPTQCGLPNCLHFEVKAFAFLKAADDLEQVPRLRIAGGAEHAHEALG